MNDAISRQSIYAEIDDWISLSRYYHPKSKNNKIPIDELRTRIKNLPSITPTNEEMDMQYHRGYIDGFKEGKATAEIFKGMTNGEVMDKLFPVLSEILHDEVFSEYWWNYPYKPQEGAN